MIIWRLKPGEDLKKGIIENVRLNKIDSGIIICIVGSLDSANLRMSDEKIRAFNGPLEIVCAQGTVAQNGIHVHIAISDNDGHFMGGHLRKGCIINTTAEICILESDLPLKRVFDPDTGYKELVINDKSE